MTVLLRNGTSVRHSGMGGLIGIICVGLFAAISPKCVIGQGTYSASSGQNEKIQDQVEASKSQVMRLVARNIELRDVLLGLNRQSGRQIVFDNALPQLSRRVTVNIHEQNLLNAVIVALKGTGLIAAVATDGETIVVRANSRNTVAADSILVAGQITGKVTDSATGKGIAGAAVSIGGTKLSAVTQENGNFRIANVPNGRYAISAKLLGYTAKTVNVTIDNGKLIYVNITLRQPSTTLSEVVTTATGLQRRIEVGNDITQINVDSVMKVMPVATLTDLLATRVPGLDVAPTSGAPGAPSRIRIRGVSSINATNDPIFIVDGVRKYSAQMERSGNLVGTGRAVVTGSAEESEDGGGQQFVPSPLDIIDPNSIETVEVLKGPSAVALYGTDAANGVIVITTKRGKIGTTQWTAQSIFGQTTMPGKWPTNYWMYGHAAIPVSSSSIQCSSLNSTSSPYALGGGCIPDSLVSYQILNDPTTTIFGRGSTQTNRATVSGGANGFTYFVSGSVFTETGYLKMPDADVALLESNGHNVPQWQRKPQANEGQNASASVSINRGTSATVQLNTMLGRRFTTTTPFQKAINHANRLPPAGASNGVGSIGGASSTLILKAEGSALLLTIPDFRSQKSSRVVNSLNNIDVRGTLRPWLTYFATTGLDISYRNDLSTLGRDQCFQDFGGDCRLNLSGYYDVGQGMTMVRSMNVGSTTPVAFGPWLSVKTSLGGNYSRTSTNDIIRRAKDIPLGATSGNSALVTSGSENNDDRSVAGVYVEAVIGLANRFYLPLSVRTDAGSGLGATMRPRFPRLAFSYLISDQPAFRTIPGIGKLQELRLRTAYGQSGVQPSVEEKQRTYQLGQDVIDGISVATTAVSTYGNTLLRPERTAEWEFGFDAAVLGGRVGTNLTWFRKRTLDALVTVDVPNSVMGGGTQRTNLGTVLNTGTEITINAAIWQQRSMAWNVNFGLSRKRNRLIKLGRQGVLLGKAFDGIQTQYVEGYPLNSQWALPVIGFADLNGDGWITSRSPDEVQVGNIPVYLGAPYPKFGVSMTHLVTVFSRFTIGATFKYKNGDTQINTALDGRRTSRAENDPSTPLLTQAYVAVAGSNCSVNARACTNIGITQTISMLQFDVLSMGYTFPRELTGSILPNRSIKMSLQGRNLGLWSNYRGKDPNVNSAMSEVLRDNGALPTPRVWQLSFSVN